MIKELILKIIRVVIGLFVFSIGNYITMVANIGFTPWDALTQGIADKVGVDYGVIFIIISMTVVVIDLIMKESIGIGTLLDAVLVGVYIDLFRALIKVPVIDKWYIGLPVAAVGLFIMALGQEMYMRGGLGCGPRDALLVGIGKRLSKMKIGVVDIIMKVVIIAVSWLLKGPIGIGTIFSMVFMGVCMQAAFGLCHFEPRDVKHENLIESFKRFVVK